MVPLHLPEPIGYTDTSINENVDLVPLAIKKSAPARKTAGHLQKSTHPAKSAPVTKTAGHPQMSTHPAKSAPVTKTAGHPPISTPPAKSAPGMITAGRPQMSTPPAQSALGMITGGHPQLSTPPAISTSTVGDTVWVKIGKTDHHATILNVIDEHSY